MVGGNGSGSTHSIAVSRNNCPSEMAPNYRHQEEVMSVDHDTIETTAAVLQILSTVCSILRTLFRGQKQAKRSSEVASTVVTDSAKA